MGTDLRSSCWRLSARIDKTTIPLVLRHSYMRRSPITLILLVVVNLVGQAQTTITLRPGAVDGKDAYLRSLAPSTNYGVHPDYMAAAQTNGGSFVAVRGIVGFDLSSIPTGSIILSAELSLYGQVSPANGGHTTLSGSNSATLRRVIDTWTESSVTWNNQPAVSSVNQVNLAATTSPVQDYLNIDVQAMVQDMVDDPLNSHGFLLQLDVEQAYRRMIFASSDHADSTLHPKLVITYGDCLELQPDGENGKDAYLRMLSPGTNYGTHPDFSAHAATNGGQFNVIRGVIDFDLSSIPVGATVNSAELSLFAYNSPANGQHSGQNDAVLERIITPWNENTVTWGNQPSTTALNAVQLPMNTVPLQHYPNIDVTAMVQDMVDDPVNSHGILFKLQTEQIYRRMLFASSDNADSTLHPKLSVCYEMSARVDEKENSMSLFPNPSTEQVTIRLKELDDYTVLVFDRVGGLVLSERFTGSQRSIDIRPLLDGMYIIRLIGSSGVHVQGRLSKVN